MGETCRLVLVGVWPVVGAVEEALEGHPNHGAFGNQVGTQLGV